jgi:hypothetical protein
MAIVNEDITETLYDKKVRKGTAFGKPNLRTLALGVNQTLKQVLKMS